MLSDFIKYYRIASKMQHIKFEGNEREYTKEDVGDDLAWHVPIYDVVNRRYAAFSSLPEAIWYKEKDPKGNGIKFGPQTVPHDIHFATMCYLFRLCGSGINYKPASSQTPWHKAHGFGNFWVVDSILNGRYRKQSWLADCPPKGFADVKGYMLPMISKGLYNFIMEDAIKLIDNTWDYITVQRRSIIEVVEYINAWLLDHGFRRQNFVATAFAMDMAEYFPQHVDPDSDVLFGSNAKRCFKLIFPDEKATVKNMNEVVRQFSVNVTDGRSKNYDLEDVMCDFIRYIENYQSPEHIRLNNGIQYYNSLQ